MSTQLGFEQELEIELALAQYAQSGAEVPDAVEEDEETETEDIKRPFWQPHPRNKPQCMAYESPADVLGYGGAAHGGKSDLLLGLAIMKHRVSKIFRREHAQLQDLIDRSREILPHDWMNLNGICRMPDGRRITLLGVKNDRDVLKHKGRPADLFGFDEATEFTEQQIRFLLGWNRTATSGQRCRAVLCFNPPTTTEGQWILDYFAPWLRDTHPNPAAPGELRWYARLNTGEEVERPNGDPFTYDGELIIPRSRSFIPARPTDNPFTDEDYISVLQSLPGALRAQMLYGDFRAGIKDDPWQVIPTEHVKLAQKRWVDAGGKPPRHAQLDAIGVDVSRGGVDQTVLAPRYLNFFDSLAVFQGKETDDGPKVANLVERMILEKASPNRPQPDINIDAIGVGTSPYDWLLAKGLIVTAINNGEAADPEATDKSKKLHFVNRRAQNMWKFREMLDPTSGHGVMLPPDPELLADLTAARWTLTVRGIQIELKKETAKRIGRSPDKGDAVINASVLKPPQPRAGKPAVAGQRATSKFRPV